MAINSLLVVALGHRSSGGVSPAISLKSLETIMMVVFVSVPDWCAGVDGLVAEMVSLPLGFKLVRRHVSRAVSRIFLNTITLHSKIP